MREADATVNQDRPRSWPLRLACVFFVVVFFCTGHRLCLMASLRGTPALFCSDWSEINWLVAGEVLVTPDGRALQPIRPPMAHGLQAAGAAACLPFLLLIICDGALWRPGEALDAAR